MTDLPFRIGQAVDVHAFAAPDSPRPLMVACLEWPGERPLEGHSDADVAAHALCDAMLLATGLGELGTVFGVDRPEWAGASGRALLQEVRRMTAEAGWVLGNATVQVVGNRPRMAARLPEACAVMSEIAGGTVTVSATTSDHLGFTGRGEGASARRARSVVETCHEQRRPAPHIRRPHARSFLRRVGRHVTGRYS